MHERLEGIAVRDRILGRWMEQNTSNSLGYPCILMSNIRMMMCDKYDEYNHIITFD